MPIKINREPRNGGYVIPADAIFHDLMDNVRVEHVPARRVTAEEFAEWQAVEDELKRLGDEMRAQAVARVVRERDAENAAWRAKQNARKSQ